VDQYSQLTDEQLLIRLQKGKRDVFETIVRRFERELFGYLKRYLGRTDLAEDVFQNTFIAVFRKIKHYEAGRSARPWLYTIATHQAIDALRRRGRRPDFLVQENSTSGFTDDDDVSTLDRQAANSPDPAEQAGDFEQAMHVRNAVDQLPELFRQVVLLAYFQGMKYQDVAEILDIPVGTVKSRLNAAINKLKEIWGEKFPIPLADSEEGQKNE
jgi:RNA polymerase sigma-70 factor, ECF subfamily